jgi:hypothetical protein
MSLVLTIILGLAGGSSRLTPGKAVTFAGSGIHKPNIREALAAKHNLRYSTTVGASTDLLVIGTDQTDTVQVRKANQQGVPIMVEATFWRRLGEV